LSLATIRYDTTRYIFVRPKADGQPAESATWDKKQKSNEENDKTKTQMLRRNGPATKSVESVLRPEGRLYGEIDL